MSARGYRKRLGWRVEAAAHTAVSMVLRRLPTETVFRLGEGFGRVIRPFFKERMRTIVRNLRIAGIGGGGGDMDVDVDVEGFAKKVFERSVANLICSSVAAEADDEELRGMLEVENPEVLEEAVAEGRGVVLLLAHMGNWELLTRMHRFFPKGTKSGAFYRPLNNLILNERVLREREADGTRLFSKRDSLHHVTGFLRSGGVIGILVDQRVGRQGDVVEFFGRLTRASPLPGLLVRRCKSEVLALSLSSIDPGRWRARYHRVERPYGTATFMAALEGAMKVSMVDVFWFQERWKMPLSGKMTLEKWLGGEGMSGRKPHRAVLWVGKGECAGVPRGWEHGDVRYEMVVAGDVSEVGRMEEAGDVPIDFIVTRCGDAELEEKAAGLGIPVFRAG